MFGKYIRELLIDFLFIHYLCLIWGLMEKIWRLHEFLITLKNVDTTISPIAG